MSSQNSVTRRSRDANSLEDLPSSFATYRVARCKHKVDPAACSRRLAVRAARIIPSSARDLLSLDLALLLATSGCPSVSSTTMLLPPVQFSCFVHEPSLAFGYDVYCMAVPKECLRAQAIRLNVSRNDFVSDCATD